MTKTRKQTYIKGDFVTDEPKAHTWAWCWKSVTLDDWHDIMSTTVRAEEGG